MNRSGIAEGGVKKTAAGILYTLALFIVTSLLL